MGNQTREKKGLFFQAWPKDVNYFILLVAVVLALEMFLIRGNVGLELADEGYLWYGAEAVFHGRVPILDFESYDPGRYYWSAFWFHVWRPGIIPLRFSETLFGIVGLFLGLLASKRLTENRWELAGMGLVLALWIFPDYKVFDCVVPMAAVYLGLRLLEGPGRFSFWISGFFVSFCGFIGRNHGLYEFISFSFLLFIAALGEKKRWVLAAFAGIGIVCGLAPFLLMFAAIPGFLTSCIASVRVELERGTTNIGLAVPWPWTVQVGPALNVQTWASYAMGVLFMAVPVFYICWLFMFFSNRGKPSAVKKTGYILLVCAAIGVPYLHYAFSRADIVHLAAAVSPFWIGFFAQKTSKRWRRALIGFGIIFTFFSIGVKSSLLWILTNPKSNLTECRVGADVIYVDAFTARIIGNVQELFGTLPQGQRMLAFPHLPTLYPVLGLESPIWGLYSVFPPAEREQKAWIGEMEKNKVQWALIDNWMIDNREDLSFVNSQPLFKEYLKNNFRIDPDPLVPPGCFLFHRMVRPSEGTGRK